MGLERIVKLFNDGKQVTVKWNGKEYKINKGDSVEIQAGVAEYWREKNPKLRIEEIKPKEPPQRDPERPLSDTGRGTAFAELKGDESSA